MSENGTPLRMHIEESGPVGKARTVCISVRNGDFLELELTNPNVGGWPENGNRYTLRFSTPGGQPMQLNGEDVEEVELTIVGDWEMSDFLAEMEVLVGLANERPELFGPPFQADYSKSGG